MIAYETITRNSGLTIEIHQDEDAGNPYEECDQASHMITGHREYNYTTKGATDYLTRDVDDYEGWNEIADELRKNHRAEVLPVYAYIHGGITIRTSSAYSDLFDSGLLGIVFMTAADIRETYMHKIATADARSRSRDLMKGEIESLDDYLTGNVWGYVVKDADGNDLDSCWGFVGDMEYCQKEAEEAASYYEEKAEAA